MPNNLFTTQNVVMGSLISGMSWGLIAIMGLKADQAVDNELNVTFKEMIPKISSIEQNTAVTALDVELLRSEVGEVKEIQKDYREQLVDLKITTESTLNKVDSLESSRDSAIERVEKDLQDLKIKIQK